MIGISREDMEAIRKSGLFDERWYLEQYPDVKATGMDPLEHYLWIGAKLSRDPSRLFSSKFYMSAHPDVSDAAINPLAHYVFYGLSEGRSIEKASPPSTLLRKEPNRIKVAVISWDVSHNPLGRAYLLAEALSRRFEVILLGPHFDRFGKKVWHPVSQGSIPIISFPGDNYPNFSHRLENIAEKLDSDVIVACKPRMPSLHLALLAKKFRNRPLIIDIDDHELAFAEEANPVGLSELRSRDPARLREPFSSDWTRFAETLVPHADRILVSNEALQRRFGGVIIPHARDEQKFDPTRFNRQERRREIGLMPSDKVVFFAGTTRAHKGVVEIASAIASLDNPHYKLAVLGTIQDRDLKARIEAAGKGRVIFFPSQRLDELPSFLVAADLVCLLQNSESAISQFQLPAKLIDAISMGIPVLATVTPPLERFVTSGMIIPVTPDTLMERLNHALRNTNELRLNQLRNRDIFLDEFSYEAISASLENIILDSLNHVKPLAKDALAFEDTLPHTSAPEGAPASLPARIRTSGRYDIVMFWKQHDTGVYGRRSDMLAKYLARHPDVRQVLMLDAPLWHGELVRKSQSSGISEHRMVYKEIQARSLGLRDVDNLSFHSFIYHSKNRHALARWPYPAKDGYLKWLTDLFTARGVDPSRAIFWLFPVNPFLGDVVRYFKPKSVVCDIVDDERAHPGISPQARQTREANYRELLALSDLAITNATPIQQSMKEFAPSMRVLPNACELEPPAMRPDFDLERLLAIPSPRLGYVGNLESKLDIELLEYVAIKRPHWNIVLVGSAHTRMDVLNLKRFQNIHFMGVVQYDEARQWIRNFDVTIMPHLVTPLTKTMNPLKIFVYATQGKITVSTEVPNVEEMNDFCIFSKDKYEFVSNIENALYSRDSDNIYRLNINKLRDNSWENRINTIMSWLN